MAYLHFLESIDRDLSYSFVFTFQLYNFRWPLTQGLLLIFINGSLCRGSSGVEQLIRNQQVVGSNPILGSMNLYKLMLVATGGMLGSVARYVTARSIHEKLSGGFPYGTLAVNIIGSFILGLMYAWFSRKVIDNENLRLLIGTGFCGGFTTFSAFAFENVNLLQQKMFSSSVLYILLTLVIGFLAVAAGLALGKSIS
jgi:fluoride exporter